MDFTRQKVAPDPHDPLRLQILLQLVEGGAESLRRGNVLRIAPAFLISGQRPDVERNTGRREVFANLLRLEPARIRRAIAKDENHRARPARGQRLNPGDSDRIGESQFLRRAWKADLREDPFEFVGVRERVRARGREKVRFARSRPGGPHESGHRFRAQAIECSCRCSQRRTALGDTPRGIELERGLRFDRVPDDEHFAGDVLDADHSRRRTADGQLLLRVARANDYGRQLRSRRILQSPAEGDLGIGKDSQTRHESRTKNVRLGIVDRRQLRAEIAVDGNRSAVEQQLDALRSLSFETLPHQPRRARSAAVVAFQNDLRFGGGAGEVDSLLDAGDFVSFAIDRARNQTTGEKMRAEIDRRRPRLVRECRDNFSIEQKLDALNRSGDADLDLLL